MADFDDGYNPDAAVIKHVKGGTFWNPTDVAIMYATSAPAKRPFELGDTPLKANDLYFDQNGLLYRYTGSAWVGTANEITDDGYKVGTNVTIFSATKPTARPTSLGGGALVTGDIWVDTATGEEWFFSPGYWLLNAPPLTVVHSNISATFSTIITTLSSGANQFFPSHPATNAAMILTARATAYVSTANNANNYWQFGPKLRALGSSTPLGSGTITDLATVADTSADSPNTAITKSWTINTLVSNYRGQGFAFNAVKAGSTGTPGAIAIIGTLSYAYALAI